MVRELAPWRGQIAWPFKRMEEELGNVMGRFFGPEEGWFGKGEFVPHTDVAETAEGFEVVVELPGMKPEEVSVEFKEGRLWIGGEKREEKEVKGKTFHRTERRYGEFRRVVPLPVPVEENRIEATFRDGVLRVVVPKSAKAMPKQIKVSGGPAGVETSVGV